MNKRISDLLDHYTDDSVDLADGSPLSSARIKELTMKKLAERKKSRLRRLPVRIAAAAAVIAALTVSALAAARILGAGDLMQGLFNQWTDEPLTTAQVEILNGVGYVFDSSEKYSSGSEKYSVTSNGATMTLIAALADEDCYYLRLRVEAPEGTVLPDLDWDTEGEYTLYGPVMTPILKVSDDSGRPVIPSHAGYRCFTLPDNDPTDNVKELALRFTSDNTDAYKFNDNLPKILSLRGLWASYRDDDGHWGGLYTEIFQGVFIFNISGSFQNQTTPIDCGKAVWSDPDTGEVNQLDTIRISPLGIKFEFRSNIREDGWRIMPRVPADVRIVMKDGSEISFEHSYSILLDEDHPNWKEDPFYRADASILTQTPEWELGTYLAFDTPLDLSQVDYVQFGEDYICHISME